MMPTITISAYLPVVWFLGMLGVLLAYRSACARARAEQVNTDLMAEELKRLQCIVEPVITEAVKIKSWHPELRVALARFGEYVEARRNTLLEALGRNESNHTKE